MSSTRHHQPKFQLISNIKDFTLWVDNIQEKNVDYAPFLYDAKQYRDSYIDSLNNSEDLLKEIIHNSILKPNRVLINNDYSVFQLYTFVSLIKNYIKTGSYEFNKLRNIEEKEVYLNGIFLKSFLDKYGIFTEVLSDFECNIYFQEKILKRADKLIAFGISTTFIIDWDIVKDISVFIRKLIPNVPIVVGGPLAFLLKEVDEKNRRRILSSLQGIVDFIVVEQNGEETLLRLLKAIKEVTNLTGISNLIILRKDEIYYTGYSEEIDSFRTHKIQWDQIELPKGTNTIPIETSRGCPFRCKFCSYTAFHKYRHKPLEVLREELASIKRRDDILYISFVDGSFNADPKRVKEICKIMIEDNIGKKWHFMGNIKGLDFEQAKLMKESGCIIANIGIESGSPFIRKAMNKPIKDNEEIARVFNNLHANNIISRGYFFVGFPGENDETINETINLINSIDIDLFRLTIFRPRLNSALYKDRLKYNLEGKGYLWKHNTCDSLKASEYIVKILKNTKPNYDPNRGVYELLKEGYSQRIALKLNELKNKMTKTLLDSYNSNFSLYDSNYNEFIMLVKETFMTLRDTNEHENVFSEQSI